MRWPECTHAQLAQHPLYSCLRSHLPGIGFPISPSMIVFGTVNANMDSNDLPTGHRDAKFLHHLVLSDSAGPLKNCLTQWLHRRYTLPSLQSKGAITATLLIRPRPGFSCTTKHNFRADRCSNKTYLLISMPITAMIRYFYLFGAIIEANTQGLLIGFATLVLCSLACGSRKS